VSLDFHQIPVSGIDVFNLLTLLSGEFKRTIIMVTHNPELAAATDIGYYSALLIVSEIGDIDRFPDSYHLCSYAGAGLRCSYGYKVKAH
jgi:hypothetical protein